MSRFVTLVVLAVTVLGSPAQAQSPDFLFGRPKGAIAFRTGWLYSRAGSDLFTFVRDQLTVDKKDFNAPAIGVDVDLPMSSRVSVMYGFEFSRVSKNSEYRNFVDNNRLPINQTTELQELSLSGGVKFALTPPGREISSHAWIPSTITPYVGAGLGAMRYAFRQKGDFVNFQTLAVEPDNLSSSGWAPSGHVFGGVDVKVLKRLYVSGEARYLLSHADLNPRVYQDFEPIDLTGMRLTAGIRYMF